MREAEVLSSGLVEGGNGVTQVKHDQTELERLKAKLAEVMAEERTAAQKHDRLLIQQLELIAQISESEAKLDQINTKKIAVQAQATDLAKRNGKGKTK